MAHVLDEEGGDEGGGEDEEAARDLAQRRDAHVAADTLIDAMDAHVARRPAGGADGGRVSIES
jgi:hypothetical protein